MENSENSWICEVCKETFEEGDEFFNDNEKTIIESPPYFMVFYNSCPICRDDITFAVDRLIKD